MLKLNEGDKAIIRQIVDRVHVSRTNESIARLMHAKIKRANMIKMGIAEFQFQAFKKEAIAHAIERHNENKDFFNSVMRGGF